MMKYMKQKHKFILNVMKLNKQDIHNIIKQCFFVCFFMLIIFNNAVFKHCVFFHEQRAKHVEDFAKH